MIKDAFENETIAQALGWRVTVSRRRDRHFTSPFWIDSKNNRQAGLGELPNWVGDLNAVLLTALSRNYDFSVSHKYLGRGKGRETYLFSVNVADHEVKGFIGPDPTEEMAEIGARALLEKLRSENEKENSKLERPS